VPSASGFNTVDVNELFIY